MTEVSKLQNDVQFIYKQNKNTPRMALCLNFSIDSTKKSMVCSALINLILGLLENPKPIISGHIIIKSFLIKGIIL